MNVQVVSYTTSSSSLVQAFVDVEIDGWLRLNGLNLLRNGALAPAQLTAGGAVRSGSTAPPLSSWTRISRRIWPPRSWRRFGRTSRACR